MKDDDEGRRRRRRNRAIRRIIKRIKCLFFAVAVLIPFAK